LKQVDRVARPSQDSLAGIDSKAVNRKNRQEKDRPKPETDLSHPLHHLRLRLREARMENVNDRMLKRPDPRDA